MSHETDFDKLGRSLRIVQLLKRFNSVARRVELAGRAHGGYATSHGNDLDDAEALINFHSNGVESETRRYELVRRLYDGDGEDLRKTEERLEKALQELDEPIADILSHEEFARKEQERWTARQREAQNVQSRFDQLVETVSQRSAEAFQPGFQWFGVESGNTADIWNSSGYYYKVVRERFSVDAAGNEEVLYRHRVNRSEDRGDYGNRTVAYHERYVLWRLPQRKLLSPDAHYPGEQMAVVELPVDSRGHHIVDPGLVTVREWNRGEVVEPEGGEGADFIGLVRGLKDWEHQRHGLNRQLREERQRVEQENGRRQQARQEYRERVRYDELEAKVRQSEGELMRVKGERLSARESRNGLERIWRELLLLLPTQTQQRYNQQLAAEQDMKELVREARGELAAHDAELATMQPIEGRVGQIEQEIERMNTEVEQRIAAMNLDVPLRALQENGGSWQDMVRASYCNFLVGAAVAEHTRDNPRFFDERFDSIQIQNPRLRFSINEQGERVVTGERSANTMIQALRANAGGNRPEAEAQWRKIRNPQAAHAIVNTISAPVIVGWENEGVGSGHVAVLYPDPNYLPTAYDDFNERNMRIFQAGGSSGATTELTIGGGFGQREPLEYFVLEADYQKYLDTVSENR
ncbi:hypothetical protein [Alkalispirochaeta alkalica]|uniref:hypothetical protein n=1 Tax=Alkalispirochaeta alkalica TaxID=46356 RepID=UPI00037E8A26|nr:hypothetical protein [Alkalispirochaeta alkalica]